MIDLDNLKYEEMKALEEFEKRLKPDMPPDVLEMPAVFYKFLKARNFNLDKAERFIRNTINWRKAFQVKTILKDFKPKEFFLKYICGSTIGYDKEGNLIIYLAPGKIDAREVLKCTTMKDLLRHFVWYCQFLEAKVRPQKQNQKRFPQVFFICDADELTLSNATSKSALDIVLKLSQLLFDAYPEVMHAVYVINAPSYYVFVYSVVKTILPEQTARKVRIFGQSDWREALLKHIDADVLPAFLGGNRTDPDGNPLCRTFIRHGGKLPDHLHLSPEERYFRDPSRVERICVPPSCRREIGVRVDWPESVIQWEFLVRKNDIGFGLGFEGEEGEVTELLPILNYDTSDGVERYLYGTRVPGKYIIIFDNTYSWLSSKEIEYCIQVIKQ